jgi:catechol 2,3-dioxygenase-like lactoylglutathione lyase family enzyme
MKIQLTSVMVNDQAKALAFYTEKLGFVIKHNVPMGEHSWITLVSPEGHEDVELLLEPTGHPAAPVFQKALYESGVPLTAFAVDDVHREYEKLKAVGVVFKIEPQQMGPATIAVFDDTVGNLIQIYQV